MKHQHMQRKHIAITILSILLIVYAIPYTSKAFEEEKNINKKVIVKNQGKLLKGQKSSFSELTDDIGKGKYIHIIAQVSGKDSYILDGSLLRIDYRDGEDLLDVFWPERIVIGPNTITPICSVFTHNPKRKHLKNAQLTVSGITKNEFSKNHDGVVMYTKDKPVVLKRKKGKILEVVEGEVFYGHLRK